MSALRNAAYAARYYAAKAKHDIAALVADWEGA